MTTPVGGTPFHAHAPRWFLRAAALVFVVLAALAGSSVAHAQDDAGDGDTATGESGGAEVRGTLRAAGEESGVEGVEFVVSDVDGNEVGRGVTDGDGNWSVSLPGAGEYSTLLLVETLPEGVSLRNPDRNPVAFAVNEGDSRPNLFPLGERAVSTDSSIKAIQLLVDGIKLGLLIGMAAIGLSLIYGTTGLTNFAHGEAVTFGAMAAYLFHVSGSLGFRIPLIPAALISVILAGLLGGLFNEMVWKKLRNKGASLISALVVSIGFSILLRYIYLYFADGRALFYRDFRIQNKWSFGVFTLAPKDLFIIIFSIVVLVCVGLALQMTRAGKAMRAVADNRDLAASSGIDVEAVIRWVWVAGTALAALGGVLIGLTESIGWDMGFRILLLMFAGVTLGGLGTAYGALFGSILVGAFIQLSTLVLPTDMKNVGALLMLVIVLLVRPQGLLGRAQRIG
jgi:neutral amino acid transport system permease protein